MTLVCSVVPGRGKGKGLGGEGVCVQTLPAAVACRVWPWVSGRCDQGGVEAESWDRLWLLVARAFHSLWWGSASGGVPPVSTGVSSHFIVLITIFPFPFLT